MRALLLLRHGLTAANEARLYCGSTDIPLSGRGREEALAMRTSRPLPDCGLYVASGMCRTEETLLLLTGRKSDIIIPELREMDFGLFEMRSYDMLKSDADYLRWIEDQTGEFPCPGGECSADFGRRVLRGGAKLLALPWEIALAVCHGGSIVKLMTEWFPDEDRGFYDWQPRALCGWRVTFDEQTPVGYEAI